MKNPDRRRQANGSGFEQLSLLPPEDFNPQWPTPDTQPARALARLLTGERLTQPSYGLTCWRLAAYIRDLVCLGWPVHAADVPCPVGVGTGRPIREYWLAPDIIAKATGHTSRFNAPVSCMAEQCGV